MKIKCNNKILFLAFFLIGFFLLLENSCKKKTEITPQLETGTFTDTVNHIVYKTVKIGSQWWMAEDLKSTKYRDGINIYAILPASTQPSSSDTAWAKCTMSAYCDNQDVQSKVIGEFYNWYAVNDSNGLAPTGWHIPSDNEWKILEEHLGMSQSDADKLNWRGTHEGEKLKTPTSWTKYGTIWPTNESGFTALANGCRMFNGTLGEPGQFATGFWWSSTSNSSDNEAWYRYLDYKKANVFRYYGPKTYGFSVRCVKD